MRTKYDNTQNQPMLDDDSRCILSIITKTTTETILITIPYKINHLKTTPNRWIRATKLRIFHLVRERGTIDNVIYCIALQFAAGISSLKYI